MLRLNKSISELPIKILFLAANPTDTAQLRLGQELRDIQDSLKLARYRDRFILEQRMSVRSGDISRALLEFEPQIVHFSGHGLSTGEICVEDAVGQCQSIPPHALASLFELVTDHVDCVLLNACYSETQMEAIAHHIPHVIGMKQAIGDRAAITFAVGFYKALGANRSVPEAYRFGQVEIQLEDIPEYLIPTLRSKDSKLSEQLSPPVQWILVLTGTIDDIKKPHAEAMVSHLSHLLGDTSLTLQKIESGSVKLFLTGSSNGFQRMQALFESKQIAEVLDTPIQEVRRNLLHILFETISRFTQELSLGTNLRQGFGAFSIAISKAGKSKFRIMLQGGMSSRVIISSQDLDEYLSQKELQISAETEEEDELFKTIERSILKILHETGHGQVDIKLSSMKKNKLEILIEQGVSYRYVLNSSYPKKRERQPERSQFFPAARNDFREAQFAGGYADSVQGSQISDVINISGVDPKDIIRLIANLRNQAQTFPSECRDDVLMELDDLESDLNTSQPSQARISRRLKRIAAIATTVRSIIGSSALSGNLNEFTSNANALAETFDSPLESIKPSEKP